MESCAPLAEGREGRRIDGCPNDRSVFGVKNAALNLKCTAATGKRNAYQQNGETCAYPKPKSGRIDDEALPELRWLRRGRASAGAENRDRALACPLQYGHPIRRRVTARRRPKPSRRRQPIPIRACKCDLD
jgi:hypothetical protein